MPRPRARLSARTVATLRQPGRYADGGGLYLLVDASGSRRWLFRFTRAGHTRDMGLGSAADVTLAQARELAEGARQRLAAGLDPIATRRLERPRRSFGEAAEAYIDAQAPRFRNAKHRWQWRQTLIEQASAIGGLPVDRVDTEAVLQVLRPLWLAKPETASRLRARIERVLDAAKAAGDRAGENPARWRGHLDHLLPRPPKLTRGHHAALPWREAPAFMASLRERWHVSALALEWTILTAARTGETIGARWPEIDGDVWTIPGSRMKAGREHRVPLCRRCLDILEAVRPIGSAWVFPAQHRRDKPLSNMAMTMLLRQLRPGERITVHGFRSTFRDWAGDETHFPRELVEQALAHVVGSAVERAYRRSDALEKRRRLMDAWAGYLGAEAPAKVVKLRR